MTRPRLKWRVQSDLGGFDEIVLTTSRPGGCLLHAEMMDRRAIFVSIGELRVWAHVDDEGRAVVTMIENDTDVGAPAKAALPGKGTE